MDERMSMQASPGKTDRLICRSVGVLCAVLACGLWGLWIHFAGLWLGSGAGNDPLGVLLVWVLSFELFFTRMAWASLGLFRKTGSRCLPVRGWQKLSVLQFAIGLAGGMMIHWAAWLVPWTLAVLCQFADERVQRFLAGVQGASCGNPGE